MSRLAKLVALLAVLVSLAGPVAFYLTYRPRGPREWAAAAADFGALAFAEPWVAAAAATAVAVTVLAGVLHFRQVESLEDPPPWDQAESRRRRRAGVLRVAAALSWLVVAVAVFRVPFEVALGPFARAAGLDRLAPPAPGVVLRVTSDPPGGRLSVNGIDRGTAPMITNVLCREGRPIRLRIVKEDLPPWEREVDCREGEALLVEARLGR